jgi:putative NADH-flavin reductase
VGGVASGQDVIVGATRPRPGVEDELVTMARALLRGAGQAAVRLVLVGGAATLLLPGHDGVVLMDDEAFPAELLPIARACAAQLEVCRADRAADWTYLSPPALLEPGERTGRFRLGRDELVVQPDGSSRISLEDFAIAVLDECEDPRHRRQRFTAGY